MPRRRRVLRGLRVVSVAGPASAAGLCADDRIVAINGQIPEDVLDLELAAADGGFELIAERDGARRRIVVVLGRGEPHGIVLRDGLGVPVRRCVNECRFCFVDQVPPGLRASLSVKDDDYRLSFLTGSFVTLTNLSETDVARIEALRLSPLYVSLHDWDDARRARLMGAPATRSRVRLLRLAAAGIHLHLQIVLCPGYNDGVALAETVWALADVEGVEDVGVVPVSVPPGHPLRPVCPQDAVAALELVETVQRAQRRSKGHAFVHAADELYLLAGRTPPACDAPCQYENGVGITAAFRAEVAELPKRPRTAPPVALLSGALAAAEMGRAAARIGSRARAYPVANRLFGQHVTVTGLLGGREVVAALRARPLAPDEWLLAPSVFLPPEMGVTLDDVAEVEIRRACQGRFVVAPTLADAFARLPQ